MTTCKTCHGSGTIRQRLGPGMLSGQMQCPRCKGTGKTATCPACNGVGLYLAGPEIAPQSVVEYCVECRSSGDVPAQKE